MPGAVSWSSAPAPDSSEAAEAARSLTMARHAAPGERYDHILRFIDLRVGALAG
jgi:hypothetical protein